MTNETTMSRTGGFSSYQAQGSAYQVGSVGGAQFSAGGASHTAPLANVGALSPDTVEFTLDLHKGRVVTIGAHGFEVIDATQSGLRFSPY